MLYRPNFFWNVLQVWMTGKDVYLQMTWSWPDKTWNILCSYCLQWNTSQSKFRNHYFLFLFAFSILSQLFLIWGCTKHYINTTFGCICILNPVAISLQCINHLKMHAMFPLRNQQPSFRGCSCIWIMSIAMGHLLFFFFRHNHGAREEYALKCFPCEHSVESQNHFESTVNTGCL